jgi:hypothetical protein
MWRLLLRCVHPDQGGEHDLFIWTQALYEHVAGDAIEPVVDDRPRRARHTDTGRAAERVPYEEAFGRAGSFAELTRQTLLFAEEVGEPYAGVLRLLADCHEVTEADATLYRWQHQGATYRQLAAIAHRVGMSYDERIHWYSVCEAIPISQRHAGHILSNLRERAA